MTETASPELFLTALTYELGEDEHDLDELRAIDPETRQALRDGGLRNYRTTARSLVELATGPVRRTVESLPDEERAAIRRLIFASNSVWDESLHTAPALSALLHDLDLPGVVPFAASMSWCANFHVALELARLAMQADGDECVLVVCADRYPEERADRLVSPKISVHSDAAASFAVSVRGGPFRLGPTRLRVDAALGQIDRNEQLVDYMNGVARGVTGIVDDTLGAAGVPKDAIARIVPNNYSVWTCRAMAQLAGFDESRVYLENVPRVAHALCADNPINLRDLAESDELREGDRVLVLGTAPYQWAASIVEAARSRVAAASAARAGRELTQPVLS